MASSMNNWLGFSLSPQELPPQQQQQQPQRHHQDEISGTDVSAECFDLSSDSSVLPSLNLPAPFGIFEAFNRNNQSQDWNMKDMSMNSDINYKTNSSSDYSMLMGRSCNSQNLENQGGPKLENFLGGHSFSDRCNTISSASYGGVTGGGGAAADYNMYPNCSLQLPSEAIADNGQGSNGGVSINNHSTTTTTTTTIGLSMIKNWLRNQPTPTQPENKNDGGCGGGIGGVAKGRPTSAQTLSLSMRTESPLPLLTASGGASGGGGGGESTSSDNSQPKETTLDAQTGAIEAVPRKSIDTFGQRTSIYRGVTRHRWTGRYEAHLWDNSCRREGQTRKGRQVYLGGYDKEEKAARAYDLAALKYWGTTTTTNFPISNYEKEIEEMKHMTRQEYVASLRRKSSGFSRGASIYRGVTRHHQHGRWQARIGRVAGNKDLYLGTFSTQEEAAEAYDIAAIKFRGLNAVTNFDMSRYDVKSILESSTLPIGGAAKRLKDAADKTDQLNMTTMSMHDNNTHLVDDNNLLNSHLSLTDHGITNAAVYGGGWPTIAFQQAQPYNSTMHYHPYGIGHQQQRATMPVWCKQEQEQDQDQDHQDDLNQLQLGNNTHNFFHHPTSALHNLMSLDEHSSAGSNSLVYSGGGDGNGGGGFVMPIATVIAQEENNTTAHGFGDNENMFGVMPDPYHGRNLYYLSQHQQSSSGGGGGGAVKASVYEYDHHHHQIQGTACNNWIPTAVPTLAPARSNNMAVCHGAQTFTVWNDT